MTVLVLVKLCSKLAFPVFGISRRLGLPTAVAAVTAQVRSTFHLILDIPFKKGAASPKMSRAFLAMLRTARPSSSSSAFGRNAVRAQRRLNSTQPAQKAQESAQKAQEKAQEALASAQKGFAKAVDMAKKVGGAAGERAGGLLGCA